MKVFTLSLTSLRHGPYAHVSQKKFDDADCEIEAGV